MATNHSPGSFRGRPGPRARAALSPPRSSLAPLSLDLGALGRAGIILGALCAAAPLLGAPGPGSPVGGALASRILLTLDATDDTHGAPDGTVPPIPEWTPTDPTIRQEYEAARKLLDERKYDDARRSFRRLRGKTRGTDGEASVDRCLRESDGGLLCEKAAGYVEKEDPRRIIALWHKEHEDVAGTFTGAEFARFYEEAMAEVFVTLADFEPSGESPDDDPEDDDPEDDDPEDDDAEEEDDEEEPAPPRGGRGNDRAGSEFGRNSRTVEGTVESGEVRQGRGALYWLTTAQIDVLTFPIDPELDLEEYRYLRLSLRSEDPKVSPPLTLIFDCEEGNLTGGGGGGGRRGAARGVNQVQRRVGFHHPAQAGKRWQDLRIDLRRFTARGNAKWPNVLSLRIVHSSSGAQAGIYLDGVILEKE